MIAIDEDALICDLAETYHIYDYKQLPLSLVAVFSVGLRENSRIKTILSEQLYSIETLLLAGMVDRLSLLLWSKTSDGQKGINYPESIYNLLTKQEKTERDELVFSSSEDFEIQRSLLLQKIGGES